MSDPVVLTLATAPTHLLVADCIAADRFALLGAGDIGQLPVTHGGRRALLGDFFTVTGERSATVRITGDVTKVEGIGAGMADGELVVDGSVGSDLGRGMAGGRIDVHGSAGDNPGGALPGAARGMTGGEIIIRGDAGAQAGAAARRPGPPFRTRRPFLRSCLSRSPVPHPPSRRAIRVACARPLRPPRCPAR